MQSRLIKWFISLLSYRTIIEYIQNHHSHQSGQIELESKLSLEFFMHSKSFLLSHFLLLELQILVSVSSSWGRGHDFFFIYSVMKFTFIYVFHLVLYIYKMLLGWESQYLEMEKARFQS